MEQFIKIVNNDKRQNSITVSVEEMDQLDNLFPSETVHHVIKQGEPLYIAERMYRRIITAYYKKFIKKPEDMKVNKTVNLGYPGDSNTCAPAFLNENLTPVQTQGQIFLDVIDTLKEPSKDIMSDSEPDNLKYRCIELAKEKINEALFWAEKGA